MSRNIRAAVALAVSFAAPVITPAWAHHGWTEQETQVTELTVTAHETINNLFQIASIAMVGLF